MFLAQLNCAQQYLGQIQVVEISKQLLSNFYLEKVNLLSNPKANPKNGLAY